VSFHRSPRHFQFRRNFCVVAPLQKQFDNLLFARTKPNSLILHPTPPSLLALPPPNSSAVELTNSHSIHIAILRHYLAVTREHPFPQAFAGKRVA
jgi:hypothetical protein